MIPHEWGHISILKNIPCNHNEKMRISNPTEFLEDIQDTHIDETQISNPSLFLHDIVRDNPGEKWVGSVHLQSAEYLV
jgi:hypothetical protein